MISMTFTEKTAIAAVIGGTAEALGGGKPACRSGNAGRFANGAVTGAFVMMLNHLMHDEPEGKNIPSKEWGNVRLILLLKLKSKRFKTGLMAVESNR
jgi:hypothetical protein